MMKAKRFRVMAKVVECLPCKDKALSSNTSTAKKKRVKGKSIKGEIPSILYCFILLEENCHGETPSYV
jgi:hypothetical protein